MNRFIIFLLLLSAGSLPVAAANVAPVVKTQIPDQTFYTGASAKIDLSNAFRDPDIIRHQISTLRMAEVMENLNLTQDNR
jgi:hypothetical protein